MTGTSTVNSINEERQLRAHYPSDEDADYDDDDASFSSMESLESVSTDHSLTQLLFGHNEEVNNDDDDMSDGPPPLEHRFAFGALPPLEYRLPHLLANRHDSSSSDDDNDSRSSSSTSTGSIPPLIPRAWLDDSSDDSDDDSENMENLPNLVDLAGLRVGGHPNRGNNNENNNNHHNLAGFPFQFFANNLHHGHGFLQHAIPPRNPNDNNGPEMAFFREFLNILRNNKSTEMYRYYVSRQERLVSWMLRQPERADDFLEATEGNTSLEHLHLDISFRFTDEEMAADDWMGLEEYYARWRKIGEGIANLQGLEELQIHAGGYLMNQRLPDWQALVHAMVEGRAAKTIKKFAMTCDLLEGDNVAFSQAFRDHSHLEKVEFRGYVEAEPMHAIAQELMTMPKLTRIDMSNCYSRNIPSRVLPISLLELMAKPSIRNLGLQRCTFSEAQCDVLAASLDQNTSLETINFQYSLFEGVGGQQVATSLQNSTKLQKLVFSTKTLSESVCAALGETLRVTKSINRLQIEAEDEDWASEVPEFDATWLDPIFEALQSNATVNYIQLGDLDKWNSTTADKFRAVLESPTTALTDLYLKSVGDASAPWQQIVPSLSKNRSVKNLKLLAAVAHTGIVATAAVLASNTTMESFEAYPCARSICGRADGEVHSEKKSKKVLPEECISARAVEALAQNSTLKRLMIDTCISHHTKDVSAEGCKQLVVALKDNFGLEDEDMSWGRQRCYKKNMETLARLNRSGRRYLLGDIDRESGVCLLGQVSDSLDCLFTHLQENPSLCEF